MRIVINKTNRPLKIRLPRGRVLHLGPRKEGQVTPQALEGASVKKLVEAGDLEILADDAHLEARGGGGGSAAPDTHGHHPHTTIRKSGDR